MRHAEPRDLERAQAFDRTAVQQDRAARRPRRAEQGAQQRRLAGPVGTEEGDDLALGDVEVDVVQHRDGAVARSQLAALQQGRPGGHGAVDGRLRPHRRSTPVPGRVDGLAEVGGDHGAIAAHGVGHAFGDLLAAVEDHDMVGHAHDDAHVVLDEQHADAVLACQLAQVFFQNRRFARVEAGGGFVEAEKARLQTHRPRDFQPAL